MSKCELALVADAVFVLSVRTFTERIKHIEQHFSDLGVDFEFIFDFDPPELTDEYLTEHFGESDMAIPHKSLVLKHMQAWRLGIERGCKRILVFEDDVILNKGFCLGLYQVIDEINKLPEGYLIFLGGSDTKVSDDFFLHHGPLIPQPIATTEGYLCDTEALSRRFEWLHKNKVCLPADHLIKHIDEACGTLHYWLERPLVQQGSVSGKFGTVLDANRKKHSRYYNIVRYRWNQFQRRKLKKWVVKVRSWLGFS